MEATLAQTREEARHGRAPAVIRIENLKKNHIAILEGPVAKTGAIGPMRSVYVRDPDLNLVEVSVYNK